MIHKSPYIPIEYSQVTPHGTNDKVKALFISFNFKHEPQLVFQTSSKILETVFKESKLEPIFFTQGFHMYVSSFEQFIGSNTNILASFLIRQKHMQSYGITIPEIVCGNVVMFGTINPLSEKLDNKDHSVPYHLIEEVTHTYDYLQKSI